MKLLSRLFDHLILYPLSFLFHRKRQRWVFGAPEGRFEGNSKFLFLWLSRFAPEVEAIWVSPNPALVDRLQSRGLKAARKRSITGFISAASASAFFVNSNGDDVDFPLSGGSVVFNLWHGVGIKNILRKSSVGANAKIFANRWLTPFYIMSLQRFKRPSFVLSTSAMMSTHFADCFDIPAERCPSLGYPRQDAAFDVDFQAFCENIDDATAVKALRAQFDELYVYAPTLRQKAQALIADALPDLPALSQALAARNAILLIKLHPRDHSSVEDACSAFSNIKAWPVDCDFYTDSRSIDGLITDYSSILYDWIEKRSHGVILYPFDYDRFIREERDLAFPYEPNVIGEWAPTFNHLCTAIRSGGGIAALPGDRLAKLRHDFWGDARRRGPASAQILAYVRDQAIR